MRYNRKSGRATASFITRFCERNAMPLVTSEKIEEWIKEAEARPWSARLIVEFIGRRLMELSNRNEALVEENIALQAGKRVEEYEQRIAHLEYQLELLKRQFGEGLIEVAGQADSGAAVPSPVVEKISLLAFNAQGRVLRLEVGKDELQGNEPIARLQGNLAPAGEPLRLLVAPSSEELLFVFTTGRVAVVPVRNIVSAGDVDAFDIGKAVIPDEPRAGETLACVAPISKIALADFFLQASRRGYLKKINASMSQSILANHYIGVGVKQAPDKTFSLSLGKKDDRWVLVTKDGYLQCLEVRSLPVSVDEAVRLEPKDHLAAAFVARAGQSVLAMTQVGKVIHLGVDTLEPATSFRVRGQALYSGKRSESGVRVVGAGAASETDWSAVLHRDGRLTLHSVRDLTGAGAVTVQDDLLTFVTFVV